MKPGLSCAVAGLIAFAAWASVAEAATVLRYHVSMSNERHGETVLERTIWIDDSCSRQDEGPVSIIIDYRSDTVALLLHEQSIYVRTERPFAATQVLPEVFFRGVEANGFTLLVEPDGEREKTSSTWPCDPFQMTQISVMNEVESEVCVAKDLPGVDVDKAAELFFVERFGIHFDDDSIRQLGKLHGVLISLHSKLEFPEFAFEQAILLESIGEEPMPKDACTVPEGYERQRFLPPIG